MRILARRMVAAQGSDEHDEENDEENDFETEFEGNYKSQRKFARFSINIYTRYLSTALESRWCNHSCTSEECNPTRFIRPGENSETD